MTISRFIEMSGKSNSDLLASVLAEVSVEQGFENDVKVVYEDGCENGDGYSSDKSGVTLKDGNKSLNLFIKHIQKNLKQSMRFMYGFFETESNVYQNIVPALTKFQKERNIKEPFDNVSRCYKTENNEFLYAIVLENLQSRDFRMHDRLTRMDEGHVLLAFKTFARLHAVSFAMKDQDPNLFAQLRRDHHDCLQDVLRDSGFRTGIVNGMRHYASIHEGQFGEKCKAISQKTINLIDSLGNCDKYEVFTHGDCWSNNIMFAYKNGGQPTNTRLVDFQIARFASPVYDLSYFFYVVANNEMLEKLTFYQNYYYVELSKRIRELGSDPDVVFPKEILIEHWTKYGLYGFALGIYVIKIILYQKSEIPTGEDLFRNAGELVTANIQNEDEYVKRINALFKHFVDYLKVA